MNRIEHANNIRELIIERTQGRWTTGSRFIGVADRVFWVPKRSDIRGILKKVPVRHHGNKGEVFDCDEYACTLKSRLAFLALSPEGQQKTSQKPIAGGVFWGRANWSDDAEHAGNWFVTREDDLVWIEPQFNNKPAQDNGKDPVMGTGDIVSHLRLVLF